ncbi:MAG: hypothetical protein FJY07_11105 [Bacteroidetes bacterium]|nr:hypothetical protein [Bacteroidota bacterium]
MRKYILLNCASPLIALVLMSWGYAGHETISQEASLSFNQQMSQFYSWTDFLVAHSMDADERKAWDPSEGPKHYIDIDNYDQFVNNGTIPQTWDSVIAAYGYYFVENQGILPWATLATFDSLKACFERGEWEQAKIFASDLGHYVGDGHMPLHITRNYNGQYSGNDGIHSRYESTMISNYVSQIVYNGYEPGIIEDINQYVFDYLYANYIYVDSVLLADDYAQSISGNTNSSAYRQALWEKSKDFTILLFSKASHILAELIYNAWIQAGSPVMSVSPELLATDTSRPVLLQNIPNPFKKSTTVTFSIPNSQLVQLYVKNSEGMQVDSIVNELMPAGKYTYQWQPASKPAGIYYLILHSGKWVEMKKMVLIE